MQVNANELEAFTARLIPGTPEDAGAREACVTTYIDSAVDASGLAAREWQWRPTA